MSQVIPLVFGRRMLDEQQGLVQARSDSNDQQYTGSFGSIMKNQMNITFAEDRLEGEAIGDGCSTLNRTEEVQQVDSTDSGELIDPDENRLLSQFHEDAMKTLGVSKLQLKVTFATGLAMAASAMELSAIPFVLPSAEIELCIRDHEKSWLVIISLLGLSVGSAGYGILASRIARRRALMSALAVNLVFAVIAAFMPTYGTAMCARFWSACGCGGICPSALALAAESGGRAARGWRAGGALGGAAAGALLAALLARATLPVSGIHTLIEDKEHFSAWHRYLLLCCVPILAALVAVLLSEESPRFLLHSSRELDALALYQRYHDGSSTKERVDSAHEYRLGELHLPAKRPPPPTHCTLTVFFKTIFQIFSKTYRKPTMTLGAIIFLTLSLNFYLSTYVPSRVLKIENERFESSKRIIDNATIENEFYNATIENLDYVNCSFVNCTFRDMFLSHVTFRNCSFYNVTFSNIKTSYTTFKGSLFVKSTMIDTDIEARRDMDSCTLNASVIRGIDAPCPRNLAFQLDSLYTEQLAVGLAALFASLLAFLPYAMRPLVGISALCTLVSPLWALFDTETALYAVEGVSRGLLTLLLFGASLIVVETYPVHLRCTAHGLMLSLAYIGALIFRSIGSLAPIPLVSSIIVLCISVTLTTLSSFVIPSHNYLL